MITTTEEVNALVRKMLAGIAQADEAMIELRLMLEAAHDGEKAITQEIHVRLDEGRGEAMQKP